MGLFDRNYDRDYGYDRNYGARGGSPRGRDRGWFDRGRGAMMGGAMGASSGRETYRRGYDRDTTFRGGASRYDQPYWGYDTWDYDREYKSRNQTDYGDPFGDREANTPIRVVEERDRGWFGGRNDYDRELRRYGSDFGRRDRQYGRNPAGYDPNESRGGDMDRMRGRTRGYDRNYGGDWF